MSLDGFIILATLCKTTADRVNAQVAITLANAPPITAHVLILTNRLSKCSDV